MKTSKVLTLAAVAIGVVVFWPRLKTLIPSNFLQSNAADPYTSHTGPVGSQRGIGITGVGPTASLTDAANAIGNLLFQISAFRSSDRNAISGEESLSIQSQSNTPYQGGSSGSYPDAANSSPLNLMDAASPLQFDSKFS